MAKVPNKGAPQFTSRALRPGGEGTTAPKPKKFDLGSIKGPGKGPGKIGQGMKDMPKPFGGRPSPRGR